MFQIGKFMRRPQAPALQPDPDYTNLPYSHRITVGCDEGDHLPPFIGDDPRELF